MARICHYHVDVFFANEFFRRNNSPCSPQQMPEASGGDMMRWNSERLNLGLNF